MNTVYTAQIYYKISSYINNEDKTVTRYIIYYNVTFHVKLLTHKNIP